MFEKIKKIFRIQRKNEINVFYSYNYDDGYGNIKKSKVVTINKLLELSRNMKKDFNYAYINTKFNGINYPVHDLDSEENLKLFKETVIDKKYIIFRSSKNISPDENIKNHYWAVIDEDIKSPKKYKDVNWHIINDYNYINVCKNDNEFCLRLSYMYLDEKPIIVEKPKNPSPNFKLFINTFEKIIENQSLEISALISKDKELLLSYNRKKKLINLSK